MKFGVVNKSTTLNRFVLHTLKRNITHLAVITHKTDIKLGILKGGNWKRAVSSTYGANSPPPSPGRNKGGGGTFGQLIRSIFTKSIDTQYKASFFGSNLDTFQLHLTKLLSKINKIKNFAAHAIV